VSARGRAPTCTPVYLPCLHGCPAVVCSVPGYIELQPSSIASACCMHRTLRRARRPAAAGVPLQVWPHRPRVEPGSRRLPVSRQRRRRARRTFRCLLRARRRTWRRAWRRTRACGAAGSDGREARPGRARCACRRLAPRTWRWRARAGGRPAQARPPRGSPRSMQPWDPRRVMPFRRDLHCNFI